MVQKKIVEKAPAGLKKDLKVPMSKIRNIPKRKPRAFPDASRPVPLDKKTLRKR